MSAHIEPVEQATPGGGADFAHAAQGIGHGQAHGHDREHEHEHGHEFKPDSRHSHDDDDGPTIALRKVAAEVGIDTVVSQALPHDKLDYVMHELEAGHHPLVVGDGLNDVLAIKAGATSIAMGERGIDIAVASADIVLLGDDLRRIPTCIRLGRRCRRTATVNAAIGLVWTVAIIAFAALGLLGAVWVAILHNVGTFIVIANAGRLLRIDEDAASRPSGSSGTLNAGEPPPVAYR
jgi:Cd2+/Zn2+-exporting ATPase